jgi:hypothetical protein
VFRGNQRLCIPEAAISLCNKKNERLEGSKKTELEKGANTTGMNTNYRK